MKPQTTIEVDDEVAGHLLLIRHRLDPGATLNDCIKVVIRRAGPEPELPLNHTIGNRKNG